MRYALLLYEDVAAARSASSETAAEELGKYTDLAGHLAQTGELLGGEAFLPASEGWQVGDRGIRLSQQEPAAGELELGGFLLVECDEARATEIAEQLPVVSHGLVEVRPLFDLSGSG